MRNQFTPCLFALLLAAAPLSFGQDAPDDMQLFLLMGQSNMAGRGKLEPQDQVTNPHIFMMTKEKKWVLAKDPVHFDKPEVIGVGLAMQFARTLLAAEPTITIGLIPTAHGGTSLRDWMPRDKSYYAWAVGRAKLAMKKGKLRGILWHQGEADTADKNTAVYAERFSKMIAQMRKDLSAEDVPVVIGEIGHFCPYSEKFNAEIPHVAASVPLCAYVSTEGLTDMGDTTHFDARSQRTLGERYAAAFLKLEAQKAKAPH